jgi:hypothetical protein
MKMFPYLKRLEILRDRVLMSSRFNKRGKYLHAENAASYQSEKELLESASEIFNDAS